MPQLDDIDRKLLRALQADASLSHTALAEVVGASLASCWRRIKALEQAGVLKSQARLVDPALVGRGVSVTMQVTACDTPNLRQALAMALD